MVEATIALTAVTGTIGLVLLGLLIWGLRTGQFKDIEEAKYQVFADPVPSAEAPWGGAEDREAGKEQADAVNR